jgi:AraC-like DNA-binding protein
MWPRKRAGSTLSGEMATLSEPSAAARVQDFQVLFRSARRQVRAGAGNVHQLWLELDGPPLNARSCLLTSQGVLFVLGENLAEEDLTLRHQGAQPIIGVHAPLRGSAVTTMPALGGAITGRAGELQLFVSPTSDSTVRLRAHVKNEAFRVMFEPALVCGLAARHAALEPLAARVDSGAPWRGKASNGFALERVRTEASEVMASEHYGSLRPLFLEARALSWLAMAWAAPEASAARRPAAREVERMHGARELLLSRLESPPTLAEVAIAVGTNDFALKRNFKAVFGQPVYSYLLGVRLAEARRLLEETNATVKEIASAVGYAHAHHFSTAFRRAYGSGPAQYRATARR